MKHPSISVALCTHNGERFVAEQLDSILAQSRAVDEIVLSDDASTDATVSIARSRVDLFLERNPSSDLRFRVILNPQALGVTRNFEQAVRATTGEIVFLSDQDDRWSPERVKLSVAALGDDTGALLVHGDADLVDEHGLAIGRTLFGSYGVDDAALATLGGAAAFELLLRRNLVTGATVALRRELAEAAYPFASAWVHDEWLAVVAAAMGRIVPLNDRLIDYRQHGSNVIGAVSLSFRGKVGRLFEPGAERNRRLLERSTQLAERYAGLPGATPARQAMLADKVEHERVRNSLSTRRLARIRPVMAEARTGRYRRFGGGTQDIARDLVQPLKR